MNLLESDLFRLVREKSLCVLIAFVALFALLKWLTLDMIVNDSSSYLMGDAILQSISLDLLGTIVAIAISFFNGKEFSNKTIRNKICCGERRYTVFLVKLIVNWIIAILLFAVCVLTSATVGSIIIVSYIQPQVFGCKNQNRTIKNSKWKA